MLLGGKHTHILSSIIDASREVKVDKLIVYCVNGVSEVYYISPQQKGNRECKIRVLCY